MEELKDWYRICVKPVPMVSPSTGRDTKGWWPHIEWCTEHWDNNGSLEEYNGAGGRIFRGESWYFVGEGWFKFKREQDATLFALKWK